MGQQFVLHVFMQTAVLGNEIIMEISFPLHMRSMHYNNYAVKCVYGTIVIGVKDNMKAMIGIADPLLNEERLTDGVADGIRRAAGSRRPDPCVAKTIPTRFNQPSGWARDARRAPTTRSKHLP